MTEYETIESTLGELRARLGRRPKVVGTRFELGMDAANDPAVFVTVLLDDDTPDEDWVSSRLDPITEKVMRALYDAGVSRSCYVHYARPANLDAATN